MNIGVHVSFQIIVSSRYMPRSGIAGSHGSSIFSFLFINLFILLINFYFWLHWVFIAVCRLSVVVASRGYSSLQCGLLTAVASLVAEHGL